ncbi:MAG: hypothetical protein Q8P86_01935 [bacterium]|nr:hypothetical protein [bacterium]
MNQKGFANIILIVVVVVLVGVVGYFALSKKSSVPNTTPVVEQTYRSAKFGLELKYPGDTFVVQGDDQYSKTLELMDKRYAGKDVELATVPNHFSVDLAKDNSVDSLIEGERTFLSKPENRIIILRTEEIKTEYEL